MHVLNPEWVVKAIYPLLTAPIVANSGGLLSPRDLPALLPLDRYPRESYGWLIELMRAFELLFSDEASRLLIPSRLPKEAPDWVSDSSWYAEDVLQLELRYDVLPESLISRFIARNHALALETGSWWRHGVAIRRGECAALVQALIADRKISLRLKGPVLPRSALLNSICDGLSFGGESLWVVFPKGHAEKYEDLIVLADIGETAIKRVVNGRLEKYDLKPTLALIGPQDQHSQPTMRIEMNQYHADRGSVLIGEKANVGEASANNAQTVQSMQGVTAEQLAGALGELRNRIKSQDGVDSGMDALERDIATGKLAVAQAAAGKGDTDGALQSLKDIGKWVLDFATKVGISVAAKAIEKASGL